MPVIIRTDLPLEQRLQAVATIPSNDFPDRSAIYWQRYCQIKQWIADEYYQSTGAGLALQGERFTRHDIAHVDDVIEMAGRMLGLGVSPSHYSVAEQLRPYELYVLLMAILLHDAGNARQREAHEKEPRAIIARMGSLAGLESWERRLIGSIAEAHGGRTKDGDKDTISKIITQERVTHGSLVVRARLLAAALRLADELSENPRRADPQAIMKPYAPPESAIHNLYCKVIDVQLDYLGKNIFLNYSLTHEQLAEEFVLMQKKRRTVLLVDYILDRIEKCDRERRYCNRFLAQASYDRISVKLEVHNANDECIDQLSLVVEEVGYPGSASIRKRAPQFSGIALRNKHHPTVGAASVVS